MFIYIFRNELFKGQLRKIISNFPLDAVELEDLVNRDNNYSGKNKWYLADSM